MVTSRVYSVKVTKIHQVKRVRACVRACVQSQRMFSSQRFNNFVYTLLYVMTNITNKPLYNKLQLGTVSLYRVELIMYVPGVV